MDEHPSPGHPSDEPDFTVLGASGFIGGHFSARQKAAGKTVYAPPRWTDEVLRRPLGHVVYCIGLTADWRGRPYDTVRAHVERLLTVLEQASYRSLLYLSSTRVYKRTDSAEEEVPLVACPAIKDDLFDLSKMLGESLCLSGPATVRVARLSNVYGGDYRADNFLSSVVRDSLRGRVVLQSNPASAKDYIAVDEVCDLLAAIAASGHERIYNVASGRNTSAGSILEALVAATDCAVQVDRSAPSVIFPPISVSRIASEFSFSARRVEDAVKSIVADFRDHRNEWEST